MENNLITMMVKRAVNALDVISADEIKELPFVVCALILEQLYDIPQLKNTSARFAQHLRQQSHTARIKDGELYEVFTMLNALWKYDSSYVSGEQLASAIKRLVRCEVTVGGPYYSTGYSICPATNAQIAIFVRLAAQPLPSVEAFLSQIIATKRFENTALTTNGLLHLLSKACDSQELRQYIVHEWHAPATPQNLSLRLSSLPNAPGIPGIKQLLTTLDQTQQNNGFWKGEAFTRTTSNSHSYLLTTSLILEALVSYQHHFAPRALSSTRQPSHIIEATQQLFSRYNEPLRSIALRMIDEMVGEDKNFEITMLPQHFAEGLKVPPALTSHQHTALGLASVCGWMAYTIYDDFLDNEGVAAKLPLANIAMRRAVEYFHEASNHHNFTHYVSRVFSAMDEANVWEVTHCRFTLDAEHITIEQLPQYGRCHMLAARSFGHALAPLAVLTHLSAHSKQLHCIESGFRHYLIARQLHDDIHDWVEDMIAGQATYVVVVILRTMRVHSGNYAIPILLPAMQRRFRRSVLPKICKRILRHTAISRQYFTKSQLLLETNIVYSLLDNLEMSVRQSLDNHQKARAFSSSMTGKD